MMMTVFPFRECLLKKYTRIFIFGAGVIGKRFQSQIDKQDKVVNLGFIDNYISTDNATEEILNIGVYKPDYLTGKDAVYDCIVLACRYKLIPEICESLINAGVNIKKIMLPELKTTFESPDRKEKWNTYYDYAEASAVWTLEHFIPRISINNISLSKVLDFPSGRGRIAEQIYKTYTDSIKEFTCCDANKEAIDYCQERFVSNNVFNFAVNKVDEWEVYPFEFEDNRFSFIYSWDAMVHFSYKWLDYYITEFYRILNKNGYVFIHHSNLGSSDVYIENDKCEVWSLNPHGRSLVSAKDIYFMSKRCGFTIIDQTIIDWGEVPNLDCITLLKK